MDNEGDDREAVPTGQQERPYRSHLSPACLSCRRRKSRCKVEANSASCLMCQVHGTECVFPDNQHKKTPASSTKKRNSTASRGERESPVKAQRTSSSDTPAAKKRRVRRDQGSCPVATPDHRSSRNSSPVDPSSASWIESSDGFDEQQQQQQYHHHSKNNNSNSNNSQPTPLTADDTEQENRHIIGPAITNDSCVLADYLSAVTSGDNRGMRLIRPAPTGRSTKPILFTAVQKRPLGYALETSASHMKCQIIEQILGPWTDTLVDIYFDKVNICFPLLDRVSFRSQYAGGRQRISPALRACLYAHAAVYWRSTPQGAEHQHPDLRYIWNLAIETVFNELHLSPGISTITATLLNVGGRPTTSMVGNASQLGAAVSLAHSLGLNRDPLSWDIPQPEKYLRMKIWWCLRIYDKWCSLAYGTPPHVQHGFYDVPAPTLEYILAGRDGADKGATRERDEEEVAAARIFIALHGLTDVLDAYLQHVYHVDRRQHQSQHGRAWPPRNLDYRLNSWVETLEGDVRRIITRGTDLSLPGAANLRLAYLSVQLLRHRIELDEDRASRRNGNGNSSTDYSEAATANRYISVRRTAEDIVTLVQELTEKQLSDFWLSVSAFTFPSTVTFLLRCALETADSTGGLARSSSVKLAWDLVTALRRHRDEKAWDLGDICLGQNGEVVEKIMGLAGTVPGVRPTAYAGDDKTGHGHGDANDTGVVGDESAAMGGGGDGGEAFMPLDFDDLAIPDASFIDELFPSVWDAFRPL